MAIEKKKELVEVLADLATQEWDTLAALDEACEHLRDARDRRQAANFIQTHRQHLLDLEQLILDRGAAPPVHGDAKEILRKAKVELGRIAGEHGMLVAMKTNSDALQTTYRASLADDRWNERERKTIERMLAEESWHGAWYEDRLGIHPDVGEAIMAEEGENERARSSASIH